jgi:hypothetical protein
MLKLFKLNKKKKDFTYDVEIDTNKEYIKNFPTSTREWYNSIYTFNENNLNLILPATLSTINSVKGYLNMYNSSIEAKLRIRRLSPKSRRLSSHRIYAGNSELKHTNDKIILTFYTHNRQKYNYLTVLRKRYLKFFKNKRKRKTLNKRFYSIKHKGFNHLKKANKDKYILIKFLKKLTRENNNLYINNYLSKFYQN